MTAYLNKTLEKFGAAYLTTQRLLADADEAQWQAGKSPVPREDTTERSRGMTSDPTPSIVGDTRRLALRAAVVEVELALEHAEKLLTASRAHLTAALTKWQG